MSTQGPRPSLEEIPDDDSWGNDEVEKVLLVEDSNDTRRMMNVLLTGYGYDVIEAVDGIEAVDQAVVEKPDLILMDIAMPIADGLFAVEVIRQHKNLKEIP